jgi:phosphoglycerate dehydrogenase-like enzyme
MKVLVTEPADEELSVERAVLGDAVTTGSQSPADIHVAIVHQARVDEHFLSKYVNLRGVIRQGAGFDKVDLNACRNREVLVANVPDYCTSEVADTAMAMILDTVRGVCETGAHLRRCPLAWQSLALPRIRRTSSLTLGIVGAGRIGSSVIQRAKPFGFRLFYVDPFVEDCPGAERVFDLSTLLSQSDIVSLHLPANESTHGMIDASFIASMKRGATLVNTARGSLLGDEFSLLEAVRLGKLSAIALDVLPCEPPVHSALFDAWRDEEPDLAGRIRITPHVGFHSSEAAIEVRRRAAEEAARILRGQSPNNAVFGGSR